jgi:ElaB/YqjD/DUF883 family membrane-anchored ribosome-binding protein
MNTDPSTTPHDQLPQTAKDMAQTAQEAAQRGLAATRDAAQQATQAAKDAAQRGLAATRDAAQHASQAAKEMYQSAAARAEDMYQTAAARAEDTLVQSKAYVRENPFPVVLGAFAVGLTLGCILGLSHHHEPTVRERFRW